MTRYFKVGNSVLSYDHEPINLPTQYVEITKKEYDDFIAGIPQPTPTPITLKLKDKTTGKITEFEVVG